MYGGGAPDPKGNSEMVFTKISGEQAKSILKAIAYSFAATFSGSFVLQASDVITAIHNGRMAVVQLFTSVLIGAVVAGVNGVAFTIEKLLTDDSSKGQIS